MTIKEYNTIGRATYEAAVKIPEVEDVLRANGTARIYDISESQKHEVWTVAHKTQINSETLREHGFTNDATVTEIMFLNRQTKCAYFS